MSAALDQLVILRTATARWHAAVTVNVIDADTADLLVLGDGADWEDSVSAVYFARMMTGKARGSGVDEWLPVPVTDEVSAAIAAAVSGGLSGYASEAYVDAAIEEIPADDDSGLCAVPGARSTPSGFTIGSAARQPSTTRPTLVTVSGGWSWTLSATGTATGTLAVKSDSGSTPSAVVISMPFSRGVGVGLSVNDTGTMPYSVQFVVAANDYYALAQSGVANGSFGTPLVVEQTM